MGRKVKEVKRECLMATRLDKEYNEKLEILMLENKRTKSDMIRLIIENFIDTRDKIK